jgi:hypothetical protein
LQLLEDKVKSKSKSEAGKPDYGELAKYMPPKEIGPDAKEIPWSDDLDTVMRLMEIALSRSVDGPICFYYNNCNCHSISFLLQFITIKLQLTQLTQLMLSS